MRFFPATVVVADGCEAMSDRDVVDLINDYLKTSGSALRLQPLTMEQFVVAPAPTKQRARVARHTKKAKKKR